ncbi:MAG TPA: serine/threonine-protein kinase [Actinomycetota bacterium]|nr:serine/threonine-protein kinase [Actinomycetota bacterium]
MSQDARIGSEIAGYRIDAFLGRGGMSVVYLATDLRLKRRAALKVLAPELAADAGFRERFISESELAASLDHPNVIPVFEAGEADGVLFIAMRYVRSTDLKALLAREGRLDPRRALSIVGQTAGALDAAHAEGLVHRDVKPGNILVAEGQGDQGRDHVYLSDFGLTKRARERTGLTRTGQFVGTVDYVAPEQIEGKEIDGRTDEYALACVLYECLTGESPYPKDDETQVLIAHLMDPVPSLSAVRPDLPPALDQVLRKGMAKRKEDRYPDCVGFVRAAADAVAGSPAEAAVFTAPSADADPAFTAPPASADPAVAAPAAVRPGSFVAPAGTFQAAPPERPPATDGHRGGGSRRRGGRWSRVLVPAVVAVMLVATVVVLANRIGSNSPQPSTSTTTGSSASGIPAGTVLLQDAFVDNQAQWDEGTQNGAKTEVKDGSLFIDIVRPEKFGAPVPHRAGLDSLSDVSVTATATQTNLSPKSFDPDHNGWGVSCRWSQASSYYFMIGTNGVWSIQKTFPQGGTARNDHLNSGQDAGVIHTGKPNTVQGVCVDDGSGVRLDLSVNGTHLGTAHDPDPSLPDGGDVLTAGSVGVAAFGREGLQVRFDDFKVVAE